MSGTANIRCSMNRALPPPVAHEYEPVGSWTMVGELYTYVVGPSTSSKALVLIYDAFGPSYQVLQGADRLAAHLNILVLVPDYFKGCGADHEDVLLDPAAGPEALKDHMACHGDYSRNTAATLQLVDAARALYTSVTSWGVFGLCWGGKIAVLASLASNTPFVVSAQAHPWGLDLDDARNMRVPHICLPSRDEPADAVAGYARLLQQRGIGEVEIFDTMNHGWMGARANLGDAAGSFAFERGYARIAEFLSRHL